MRCAIRALGGRGYRRTLLMGKSLQGGEKKQNEQTRSHEEEEDGREYSQSPQYLCRVSEASEIRTLAQSTVPLHTASGQGTFNYILPHPVGGSAFEATPDAQLLGSPMPDRRFGRYKGPLYAASQTSFWHTSWRMEFLGGTRTMFLEGIRYISPRGHLGGCRPVMQNMGFLKQVGIVKR